MSRKPTKKMIDRGVAFAWNVKLSSEYSWSQYVSDLYQHMDAASKAELTNPSLAAVAQVVGNAINSNKANPLCPPIRTPHEVRALLQESFPGWGEETP